MKITFVIRGRVEIERWIWLCAGKRAESLGKEKNPESGAERSRREKQVVVATPVVGALMHLCIHISALETSRKKSSSPPVRAERQRGAEEEGGCEDDDGTESEEKEDEEEGKKAVGVKLLRNNNTDSSWLLELEKKKKSEYMKRNDESSVASRPPRPSSVPFRNIQFPSSNIFNIWNILEIVW